MTALSVAVLIVAAGRGTRMGADVPKQFLDLGGRPVLSHAIEAFARHPLVTSIVVVIHPDDEAAVASGIAAAANPRTVPIATAIGGLSRQLSVGKGLTALQHGGFPSDGVVLIHDAARPFVGEALITRAIAAALAREGAIPVLPLADSILALPGEGKVPVALDRNALRAVQTPQAFRFGAITRAHHIADIEGITDFSDDAAVLRHAGGAVGLFEGCSRAFKLTTAEDLARARSMLGDRLTDWRTATGYDVHAFGPGDHIMLGGVRIPHDQGVIGHSDADVLLHALTDAVLGCLADGDIGVHFPPSDMRWKGAESRVFLAEAVRRVHARGGAIRHLDGTVVAEAPRIGPHREAIRATIAGIAGIAIDRVGLKATTSEKMGFTGRREGIAALATATIILPEGA